VGKKQDAKGKAAQAMAAAAAASLPQMSMGQPSPSAGFTINPGHRAVGVTPEQAVAITARQNPDDADLR